MTQEQHIPRPTRDMFPDGPAGDALYSYMLNLVSQLGSPNTGTANDEIPTNSDRGMNTAGVNKTVGDAATYEDDGSGNSVIDHPNAPRVNGEAIRPEWILVEEVVLNGEGLDHTFSGLDGDADRKYKLTFDGEIPAGGASYPNDRSILVQPFSDSLAGNYHTLKHRFYHNDGDSTTHGLNLNNGDVSGLQLTRSDWSSIGKVSCEMIMEVEQGNGGRLARGESCFIPNDYGDRHLVMHDNSRYDGNTASNMTSIRVFWSNGTGDALTGVLRLFKPGF